MNKAIHKQLHQLFEELVPVSGKADSLAGEIVRATSRIDYRFFNGGGQMTKKALERALSARHI